MSLSTSTWSCPCAVPCEHASIVAAWLRICDRSEAHTHVDSEGQLTSASSDELLRCIPTGTVCARQDRHPQPRDDSIFHQRHGRHTATNLYRHLRYWSHAFFTCNVHLIAAAAGWLSESGNIAGSAVFGIFTRCIPTAPSYGSPVPLQNHAHRQSWHFDCPSRPDLTTLIHPD